MAEDMGRDGLGAQAGAVREGRLWTACWRRYMTPCRDRGFPRALGKTIGVRQRCPLPKPCLQDPTGLRPQRDGAFLASFAVEVEEGRGAKADLRASQVGHFGDPGAAVIHGQQEGMIAAPYPVGAVGGRQQGLHFVAGEIANRASCLPA